MAVVPFGRAEDILHCKIKLQQLRVSIRVRVRFQPILQGSLHRPQRAEQSRRKLPQKHGAVLCIQRLGQFRHRVLQRRQKSGLCGVGFRCAGLAAARCQTHAGFPDIQKCPVCAGQRGPEGAFSFAKGAFCLGQTAFEKACGVHSSGPVRKVVCLIDQEQPVAGSIKEPLQVYDGVEQIIVVADHHIAPFAQVQPQLKGTHRKTLCRPGQRGAVKAAGTVQQCGQGILDAIIVAVGIGTELRQTSRMSFRVRVKTDLFLGGQGHAAQRKLRRGSAQPGNGILGRGLSRIAGGEVKELFAAALTHGPQGGEEDAHGLADAGGCLTEQTAAAFVVGIPSGAAGTVDFPRQCPLPGAVLRKRKRQSGKALAAPCRPVQLPPCPWCVLTKEFVQKLLQLRCRKVTHKADDLIRIDLIIGQLDVQLRQALPGAVNGTVYHALRPVAGVHILGDRFIGDSGGLDLVNDRRAGTVGKNAVRTSFQKEREPLCLPLGREKHLGLIVLSGRFLQLAVDACTFQRTVKAGKTAVDAAGAQQKLHQLADGQMDRGQGGSLPFL